MKLIIMRTSLCAFERQKGRTYVPGVCSYIYAPLSQIFSYPGSRKLWFYCPAMFKMSGNAATDLDSGTSIVRVITVLKIPFWHYSYFREVDDLPTSSNLSWSSKKWGGGGGERERLGLFCPMVRFSHEEFNLVPERTSGMKNENKGLRFNKFPG